MSLVSRLNTGTATITVAPYSMEPIFIAGDFTAWPERRLLIGNGICTLFDDDDVNCEFISEPGLTTTFTWERRTPMATLPQTACSTSTSLATLLIEGCQDPQVLATTTMMPTWTDGDCDIMELRVPRLYWHANPVLHECFGDGWNGATYTMTDLDGS